MGEKGTNGEAAPERVDVKELIRQASHRVTVSELVDKGKKSISLMSQERIDQLINQAVRNIVNKYRALAAGLRHSEASEATAAQAGLAVSREQVELESRVEFHDLLTQYEKADRAARTVKKAAAEVSSDIDEIARDAEAQRISEQDAEQMLAAGFAELEGEIARTAARAFEDRRTLLERDGPEASAEWSRLEEALAPAIRRVVQRHAELFFADGRRARDKEVALLEKRLSKMRERLDQMEEALKAIAAQKLISNTQMRTLLQSFGILEDDPFAEKKREMLKVILEQNIALRRQLQELEAGRSESPERAA